MINAINNNNNCAQCICCQLIFKSTLEKRNPYRQKSRNVADKEAITQKKNPKKSHRKKIENF